MTSDKNDETFSFTLKDCFMKLTGQHSIMCYQLLMGHYAAFLEFVGFALAPCVSFERVNYVRFVLVQHNEENMRLIISESSLTCCGILPGYSLIDKVLLKESRIYKERRICHSRLAPDLKTIFH